MKSNFHNILLIIVINLPFLNSDAFANTECKHNCHKLDSSQANQTPKYNVHVCGSNINKFVVTSLNRMEYSLSR